MNELVDALRTGSADEAQAAADLLVELGPPAVDALLATIGDRSRPPWSLSRVAQMLGRLNDQRAVEPLIGLLTVPDPPDPPSIWPVRCAAAAALGALRASEAVDALVAALLDGEWEARDAADALAAIGDPRAIPGLVAAIPTGGGVTLRSLVALVAFGPAAVPALRDALPRWPDSARVIGWALRKIEAAELSSRTGSSAAAPTGPGTPPRTG